MKRQIHQLKDHQIKLERENKEILESRSKAEALLEKYTKLYDDAPVGYLTLTANSKIQLVNLTLCRLLGKERSGFVGQKFDASIAVAHRPQFRKFLKQVFSVRDILTQDFDLLCKGNVVRSVNLDAQRSKDGLECQVMVVDITERKTSESKMRISEIRYRRLFEAAHDGVLLMDPATSKITDANPFMTHLLGYSHEQLLGKQLYEIGLLKDEAASREMFRNLKKDHQVRYEDLPLENKSGKHQEVEVVANVYQENGHSVIQCNIRDITERRNSEVLLQRNEALFSALIERAPVGVYVVDDSLRFQQANPTAVKVFQKVQPVLGRKLSEVMGIMWPSKTAKKILAIFTHTLKTGEPYESQDFMERRCDTGVEEYYEWQLQRVIMPAGDHAVVCFFNDLTPRKRDEEAQRSMDVLTASNRKLELEIDHRKSAELALRKSERELANLLQQSRMMQEQMRQLSRGVLHAQEEERKRISRELHDVIAQTLVGINFRLSNLGRESELGKKNLGQDIAQTQVLVKESIISVQHFARELRPAVLDDLGLIPALHSFLEFFTKRTAIKTSLNAYSGVEELDSVQRTALFRIAQESLTNVSRHAKAGRVQVFIRKLPDEIEMQVKDNGKSFVVDKIRRAKGRQRLGLLGMKERLEMIGGTFTVESVKGRGTTITAKIPSQKTVPSRKARILSL